MPYNDILILTGTSERPTAAARHDLYQVGHDVPVRRSAAEIVRDHLRRAHRLEVGSRTPPEILCVVRTAEPLDGDFLFEVRGQGPEGEPATAIVGRSEIRAAVRQTA